MVANLRDNSDPFVPQLFGEVMRVIFDKDNETDELLEHLLPLNQRLLTQIFKWVKCFIWNCRP
jgi:hypothetical protein